MLSLFSRSKFVLVEYIVVVILFLLSLSDSIALQVMLFFIFFTCLLTLLRRTFALSRSFFLCLCLFLFLFSHPTPKVYFRQFCDAIIAISDGLLTCSQAVSAGKLVSLISDSLLRVCSSISVYSLHPLSTILFIILCCFLK